MNICINCGAVATFRVGEVVPGFIIAACAPCMKVSRLIETNIKNAVLDKRDGAQ